MGLLDDAIREHLELKRRRGADAEEVTRQEQEALGAPQRAEFADAAPAAAPAAPAAPAAEAAPPPEAAPPEVEPAPDEGPSLIDEPPLEPADEPEGWRRDEPERENPRDQQTAEYSPEPPPETEGEDVLEETPDFLQETPEHDRLWFEQKPPRDFEF